MASARSEESRIALAGAVVLALALFATGLAVFFQTQGAMERLLTADLEFDLNSRRTQFDRAISFRDADGRELAAAGEFAASRLRVPLSPRARGAGALLWDGELLLDYRIDFVRAGVRLGEVHVQHRLRELRGALQEVAERGPTSELALCAARGERLHCAPTRFQAEPFDIPSRYEGRPLPMTYALAGAAGVVKLVDYRGQRVVAAYAPLGMLDAGLVLKVDLEELTAPSPAGRSTSASAGRRCSEDRLWPPKRTSSACGNWCTRRTCRGLARRSGRC